VPDEHESQRQMRPTLQQRAEGLDKVAVVLARIDGTDAQRDKRVACRRRWRQCSRAWVSTKLGGQPHRVALRRKRQTVTRKIELELSQALMRISVDCIRRRQPLQIFRKAADH
jgi:hypothetical protein